MRFYLVSSLAGALEPCGCVKDMLGGVDHFAALLQNDAAAAPRRLVLGAGPTLFMGPELDPKRREQDLVKARALADVLAAVGLVGWSPAANDWAGGSALLAELAGDRLALFAANLPAPAFASARVYDLGGERVGVTGVSRPTFSAGAAPAVAPGDPRAALESARDELVRQGAKLLVALVSLPRGEALRLAEVVPGFSLFVLGKPVERGEQNDPPTPPVRIGNTLVVEGQNHLQSVAVVDFFVRDGKYTFVDGSGIAEEERRLSVKGRIDELERAIARPGVAAADREARRRDLQSLRAELERLQKPRPEPSESSFSYRLVEVREGLGSAAAAKDRLAAYYRAVNEHNQRAFAGAMPPPVPEGNSGYVGVAACTSCHQSERAFWDKTPHQGAYATLARQDKQFNLECVGCHVTGYEEPGGTTVTHVENLTAVQCEVCHGPGSRHVKSPIDKTLIDIPDQSFCGPKCHHPPHVHPGWSAADAWSSIVGPGHQLTAPPAR